MPKRWTEYVPLDDLLRAPRNPKGHAAEVISASLKRFGYVEQITVDERTGRLVAGHGRLDELERARASGDEPVDGIDQADDGRWLVPVARGWASKDDAEAEAYLLTSNQSTVAGGWEQRGLADILSDLAESNLGLDGTGFALTDLDDLLTQINPPTLDDLRKTLGDEPTEDEMWPMLRLRLQQSTLEDMERELGDEGSDDERVRKLLGRLT